MSDFRPRGPKPKVIELSPEDRAQLHRIVRSMEPGRVVRRALAILALSRGEPVEYIARFLNTSRQAVTNWRESWERHSDPMRALSDREHPGRPPEWTEERQALLESLLQRSPEQWGYRARSWTSRLLLNSIGQISGWRPSERSLRMELKNLGYVYKRPRYELEPDPQLAKKSGSFAGKSEGFPKRRRYSSMMKPISCSSRR